MNAAVQRRLLLLGVLVVGTAMTAQAGSTGCTVDSTGLTFGTYSVFASQPTTITGSVSYSCTGATAPVTITLGTGSGGSFAPRRLDGSTDVLQYNLYLDGALSSVWGDGVTSGTAAYTGGVPTDGLDYTVPVFGGIPAGQNVAAGTYTDSVVITVWF